MLEDPALPRPTTVTWLYCSAIEVSISVRQAPGIWLHCPPAHKSFLHTLWDSAVFSGLVKYDLLFIRFQASEKWVTLQNYRFHASLPNLLRLEVCAARDGYRIKTISSPSTLILTSTFWLKLYRSIGTRTVPYQWRWRSGCSATWSAPSPWCAPSGCWGRSPGWGAPAGSCWRRHWW